MLLITFCLLSACQVGQGDSTDDKDYKNYLTVYLDNPFEKDLLIRIDTSEKILDPLSGSDLLLEEGKHHITSVLDEDSTILDTTIYLEGFGAVLLNTARQQYIKKYHYFTDDQTNNPLEHYSFTLDSIVYETCRAEVYENDHLLIDKTWEYGVDDDLPEQVLLDEHEKGKYIAKLYRKDDFVVYETVMKYFRMLETELEEAE